MSLHAFAKNQQRKNPERHATIICSDYGRSKHFYVNKLGLEVVRELYRGERDSWKLDLRVGG